MVVRFSLIRVFPHPTYLYFFVCKMQEDNLRGVQEENMDIEKMSSIDISQENVKSISDKCQKLKELQKKLKDKEEELARLKFEVRDMEVLATALKTTSGQLVNRFKENFSERFSNQFDQAQEAIKNVTEEDIERSQQDIIRALRELEKKNRISNLKELKRSQT